MSDIYKNAILGWKKDRVHYQIPREEREQKYQQVMSKYFKGTYYEKYKKELYDSKTWKELRENKIKDLALGKNGLVTLYAITRKTKPNWILETGTQYGCTTAIFLLALEKNKKGTLISIDSYSEESEKVGIYVPSYLKHNWINAGGKTTDRLYGGNVNKKLFQNIKLDFFFHDSWHVYQNMYHEYVWAFQHLKDDGIIASHDIGTNNAFYDFADNYGLDIKYIKSSDHFGIGFIEKINYNVKPIEEHIKRLDKPIPKKHEYKREHFNEGRAFVKKIKKEFNVDIVLQKGKVTGLKDFYDIKIRGKLIAHVAPRAYCLYGGYIKGKAFRIASLSEEKQLFEEIKKAIEESKCKAK